MIRNVLIPEKIKNYYLFSKRIVGFDIDKTNVAATQIYLRGSSVIIERCVDEKLEIGNKLTHDQKVVNAIKNIIASLGRFDEIHTAVSSSQVIFKTLKLPFTSYNKIKMVINYEVEPLLPFSLDEAFIDFIITKEMPQENSSEVMVAAVQKSSVESHIALFKDAGVMPHKVVVDLFSLYSLYKKIPAYSNLTGGIALIDIGFSDTRIAYIYNGRLAFVRTLTKGVFSQARQLSTIASFSQSEAIEAIMRFGAKKEDDQEYNNSVQQALSSFWSDIRFTLQSFTSKLGEDAKINKIFILGQGSNVPGITNFVDDFLGVSCELFSTSSIIDNKLVKVKNSLSIPRNNIISLGVALPSDLLDAFNLYVIGLQETNARLLNKQLIVAGILILSILLLLFIHSFMQKRSLANEVYESEKEAIAAIKKSKIKIPEEQEGTDLEDIADSALEEVGKKEGRFNAFSGKARASMLNYLRELHSLDKEGLGLEVQEIKISLVKNQIILKASVKDYDALRVLRKELKKSDLFSAVTLPTEKEKFEMEITLAK